MTTANRILVSSESSSVILNSTARQLIRALIFAVLWRLSAITRLNQMCAVTARPAVKSTFKPTIARGWPTHVRRVAAGRSLH